jgi:hypoxanthine-guanine phosphoribosyltransferase
MHRKRLPSFFQSITLKFGNLTMADSNVFGERRLLILDDDVDVGKTIINIADRVGVEARAVENDVDFF